jgi:hypothetical protein
VIFIRMNVDRGSDLGRSEYQDRYVPHDPSNDRLNELTVQVKMRFTRIGSNTCVCDEVLGKLGC